MNKNYNKTNLKKLLYKSSYRGCKETDIIIGSFAVLYLDKMTNIELKEFAEILELNDADIYDWYTNKKDLPHEHNGPVMQKLMKYIPNK